LLSEALQILISSELIERQGDSVLAGQVQFGFRHSLMRDAAYALLAASDRVVLHRQAGRFLSVQPGVEPKMVAEHLVKGQEALLAVPWFLQAARRAFDSNDLGAARADADQAASCGADGDELRTIRALRREIAYWSGDYTRCRALAEEELAHLQPGTARWYQAMTHAVVARGRTGDLSGLQDLCTEMVEAPLREGMEAVVEKIVGLCRSIFVLRNFGSVHRAESLCRVATELIVAHRVAVPKALAQYHEMRTTIGIESPLECMQHCEKSVVHYEEAGDVRNLLFMRAAVYVTQGWLGAGKDAEQGLRATLALSQKMQVRSALAHAQMALAIQLVRERRDLKEARQLLQQAGSWYREIGFRHFMKVLSLSLAEVDLLERNYEQALNWIAESRAIAKTMGVEDFYVGTSFALEAQCLLGQGRPAEALPAARRAYELRHAARGVSPALWDHLPGLALTEVLMALGEPEEARQILGLLCDLVYAHVIMIPHPEWRSTFLRIPDYARIQGLAVQLGVNQDRLSIP
jgi:hypothetical protein